MSIDRRRLTMWHRERHEGVENDGGRSEEARV